jgi:hypothetical protein
MTRQVAEITPYNGNSQIQLSTHSEPHAAQVLRYQGLTVCQKMLSRDLLPPPH